MPIRSPNPDLRGPAYSHPIETRPNSRPIPMAFQITSPFNKLKTLLPHALVLHVNPLSLQESHNQKVERFSTRGGFVEQHWGHDLVEVSADQSTGAFINLQTGLSSALRRRTIAWDRFRDLHDLFRNNGAVYAFGNVVLQGNILLYYDRGTYLGGFRTFEWEETADSPFVFKVSWSFKVEHTIMSIDFSTTYPSPPAPAFQGLNTEAAKNE